MNIIPFILILINILKSKQFHQDPTHIVRTIFEEKISQHITREIKYIEINPFFQLEIKNITFILSYDNCIINEFIPGRLTFNQIDYINLTVTMKFNANFFHRTYDMFKDKPTYPLEGFYSSSPNNIVNMFFDKYIIFQGDDYGYHYEPSIMFSHFKMFFGVLEELLYFKETVLNNNQFYNKITNLFFYDVWFNELEGILTEYPQNKVVQLFHEINTQITNTLIPIEVDLTAIDQDCKHYNNFKFNNYKYSKLERMGNEAKVVARNLAYDIEFKATWSGYHRTVYFDVVTLEKTKGFTFGKIFSPDDCIKLAIQKISTDYFLKNKDNFN